MSLQNRAVLAAMAQHMADTGAAAAPAGSRIVVVVTDEAGDFVGVGSNTSDDDVQAILVCALYGEERLDHVSLEPSPSDSKVRGVLAEISALQKQLKAWEDAMPECAVCPKKAMQRDASGFLVCDMHGNPPCTVLRYAHLLSER